MSNVKFRLGVSMAAFAVFTGLSAPALAKPVLAPAVPAPVKATDDAPDVYGREVYLLDATTGKELFNKDGGERMPIASLTKIMTAYVTLQQAKPTDKIKITSADESYADDAGGTSANIEPGDTLPVSDLLYGLMLPSGADVAHAFARTYGPGIPKFVAKMNAAAKQLGLKDTLYVNPDGLPESGGDGYSTARDQARLAQAALQNPTFLKVSSTQEYTADQTKDHGEYTWDNSNHLLGDAPGAIGVKTGFTQAAGFCLTFAADRHGHRLIGVILGEDESSRRFDTAESLLDWASDSITSAS